MLSDYLSRLSSALYCNLLFLKFGYTHKTCIKPTTIESQDSFGLQILQIFKFELKVVFSKAPVVVKSIAGYLPGGGSAVRCPCHDLGRCGVPLPGWLPPPLSSG